MRLVVVYGEEFAFLQMVHDYYQLRNSALMIIIAVSSLVIAVQSKPRYNKLINYIGLCTFGIYLLHEHSLMRPFIWKALFNNAAHANSPFLWLRMIMCVTIIFAAGIITETIRKKVFSGKPVDSYRGR